MPEVKAKKGKFQLYGIVRDKNGKPKFKDNFIPKWAYQFLTDEEIEEIENGSRTRNSTT